MYVLRTDVDAAPTAGKSISTGGAKGAPAALGNYQGSPLSCHPSSMLLLYSTLVWRYRESRNWRYGGEKEKEMCPASFRQGASAQGGEEVSQLGYVCTVMQFEMKECWLVATRIVPALC